MLRKLLKSTAYSSSPRSRISSWEKCSSLNCVLRTCKKDVYYFPSSFLKEKPIDTDWSNSSVIRFQYHYEVLPHFLISRVIVRLHRYLKRELFWRYGCIIEDKEENLEALIEANPINNTIDLVIKGEGSKRTLLSYLRKVFQEVHDSFSKLKIQQLIPLFEAGNHFVDYEVIRAHIYAGKQYYFDPWTKKKIIQLSN